MTKIKSNCDTRCQYAYTEEGECDCRCEGRNHGKGQDVEIRSKQAERHSKTKRAFRKYLNAKDPGLGRRLYRRNRDEFNKQYDQWLKTPDHITTIHSKGMGPQAEVTVIKDSKPKVELFHHTGEVSYQILKETKIGENIFQHVRYLKTKKTAYLLNGKVITKAKLPENLGW